MLWAPSFDFDYSSGEGLSVISAGIPIIRGSSIQYYAPGWKKGYYSSNWTSQKVARIDSDTLEVKFRSESGLAHGEATYRRVGDRLLVDFALDWGSSEPAQVELCTAKIWQSPFVGGSFQFGGQSSMPLPTIAKGNSLEQRTLGTDSKQTLSSRAMLVEFSASEPATCFDARGYAQDWAEGKSLFWQGFFGLPVKQGATTKVHFEYRFAPSQRATKPPAAVQATPRMAESYFPIEVQPPLVPQPKNSLLDWKNTAPITGVWDFPAGRPKFFDLLTQKLAERFEFPAKPTGAKVAIDGGMSDLQKRPGGYRLVIRPGSISMYGETESGLRNAVYRLVQMAFVKGGQVVVPTGTIEDEPRSDYRGVHLFVGPQAPAFQKRLFENVLLPLGINNVVLQCERTEWKTLPKVGDSMTMKQADLVELFGWYRKRGVEPTPLIQSFGHMEWFFARGANLDLAYNRDVPYAVDPRKPEARELVGKLWDEVATVLRPKTMHFGLDEVDMRGFSKSNPAHVTELWEIMLPALGEIAKRNNAKMMLWGDEALAPSEAVDATNGDDLANARLRRKAIPKGATIADWHYKADQNHRPFIKSLQTWKLDEFKPIASMWYRPENIRGFSVAADIENVGTLQTTWAGYESNELNMIKQLKQFECMVLAADYGWSGRTEMLQDLDYRPDEVFARMYAPRASVLRVDKGTVLGDGDPLVIGGTKFCELKGTQLAGISGDSFDSPTELSVPIGKNVGKLNLALAADGVATEGTSVGFVHVEYADGTSASTTLLYGAHVRGREDTAATLFGPRQSGITNLLIPVQAKTIKSLRLIESDLNLGLRLFGVTYK